MLFAKEPAPVEVVNDTDPEIAQAFRFAKSLTDAQLRQLEKKPWTPSKSLWKRLKASSPSDPVDRFHRFAYLKAYSFNRDGGFNYSTSVTNIVRRLSDHYTRLKSVRVRCGDYEKVIREFDGPDTFFFLDPPYAGYDTDIVGHKKGEDWDEDRFLSVIKGIKGKVFLTYGTRGKLDLSGFHVRRWRHDAQIGGRETKTGVTVVATNYKQTKRIDEEVMSEEVVKAIWGSPAGKSRMTKVLVPMIPEHKTYVEPFAGSAAVLFAKELSDVEVVNDLNPDIMRAFRDLKAITKNELDDLRKRKWVASEDLFARLKTSKPASRTDRLYKFLYTTRWSHGKWRKSFSKVDSGKKSLIAEKIEPVLPRLRKLQIRNSDYLSVVKEFDSPDTFFFFDPPYSGYNGEVGEADFDENKFVDTLKRLKGKFLVTYGNRGSFKKLILNAGFVLSKTTTDRPHANTVGRAGSRKLHTLIVTNYKRGKAVKKSMSSLSVGDPEYLVARMARGDVAGALSRSDMASLLDRNFLLIGDDLVFGVVRLRTGVKFADGKKAIQALGDKLSQTDRENFEKVAEPVWFHSFALLAKFDPPREISKQAPDDLEKVPLTTEQRNRLPDSSFLHIRPGGEKDETGRTVPQSNRMFPVKTETGNLDPDRIRNALSRIPQSDLPRDLQEQLSAKAKRLLEEYKEQVGKFAEVPIEDLTETLGILEKEWLGRDSGGAVLQLAAEIVDTLRKREAPIPDLGVVEKALELLEKQQGEQALLVTGVTDGHFHFAFVDRQTGKGATSFDDGHGHLILDSEVKESEGHTHELAGKQGEKREKGRVVHAVVLERTQKQDGQWVYVTGVGPVDGTVWKREDLLDHNDASWLAMAKTLPTDVVADVGEVLAIEPTDFLLDTTRGASLTWSSPSVLEKTAERANTTEEVTSKVRQNERKSLSDLPYVKAIPLLKADSLRFVLGIVLEPNDGADGNPLDPDAQKDVYSEEDVRKAAWEFMIRYRGSGLMHERETTAKEVEVVESFVSPVAFTMDGQKVRKGTWLIGSWIHSDEIWNKVKTGELGAFSVDGEAERKPVDVSDGRAAA